MTDAAKPVVEIQDVSFSFGRHPALLDATATIREGQFVSIVGPNGGGKTTLLKLILGLIQPDRGKIQVLGGTPARTRHRIGYMPQHAHVDPQFPVTVMDVVLMGRLGQGRMWGPFRKDDRAIALAALEETEALNLETRPFSELSGGQRQKVLIARALACEPEMLLLDEPTSSLDPGVQDDVFELLHRLNQRMTVVLVSHDVSVVSQHVDKILCVNQQVEEHEAAAIKGALDELFPSTSGVALVQHGHDHGHHHHPPGGEPR